MKKNIFIFAILSLIISFTSCTETKKEGATTETAEEQAQANSNQKVEKLDAPEFKMKMIQLKVYNIVDVRTPEEFAQASIPKAKNINFNGSSFDEELSKLEKNKPLFIYCKSGGRSAKAVEKAKEMGFERIIELEGGMESWKAANIETAHGI